MVNNVVTVAKRLGLSSILGGVLLLAAGSAGAGGPASNAGATAPAVAVRGGAPRETGRAGGPGLRAALSRLVRRRFQLPGRRLGGDDGRDGDLGHERHRLARRRHV